MASRSVDVAILGGGIIGIACALRLSADGREVIVLDPQEPGSGCSYGNAGTLAPYAVVPVGNPDVLRALPKLIFDADSPLAIRWAGLPSLLPWLARFVRQSLPYRAHANALALAAILKDAIPAWQELAAEGRVSDLFRHEGCLYLFRREGDDDSRDWGAAARAELGVALERLTARQVADLEPSLPPMAGGGILFRDAAHVTDPGALTKGLALAAAARGAAIRRAKVEHLEVQPNGRTKLSGPDLFLEARKVVIAAGAWSKPLALQVGDRIPLDTERGYHLEFAMEASPLRRPVCPIDLGFYLTPMEGRLRAAGTVELGGLEAPADPRRLALLERGARKIFPHLGPITARWLGFRPSLPDSLPVIGRARISSNIIYAFGHGHLGLTLAAITSRLVARLIGEQASSAASSSFAATRFGI